VKSSQHEVLDAVADLVPFFTEHAAEVEQERRLPDEVAKALRECGVMRLLQPKRFGGYEAEPAVFYEAVMMIAAACGSAGWVAGVVGVHPWQIAVFDERAQIEIWGEDPDTWVSSSYLPTGQVTPVDGGYRVSGRWNFSSGSDHGRWAVLGGTVDNDGAIEFLNFLVPRTDYEVEDVWHVVGVAGSGSNDVVIQDAFVPSYRVVDSFALTADHVDPARVPGLQVNTGPLYRMPFAVIFADCIAAAMVGMAEGALDLYTNYQKARVRPILGAAAENPFVLSSLAEATWAVGSARLQLLDDLADMWALVQRDEEIPLALRYRARLNQVMYCDQLVAAIDGLFIRAGGMALRLSNPLQRLWRDLRASRNHAICIKENVTLPYGNLVVGVETTGLYA
jgi:3-hydroxy-9,10-secoandrosta-1,3,5(10)-triene-9,17-dione monooxygenase